MKAKSKTLYTRSEPSNRPILSCSKRSALRPTILKKIPSACDTLNSAHSTCSSAPASSKPAARPSLVPAANSPACSGQDAARTPSSLSAAATSTDALKTTGLTVRWLEFHSHVVHPSGFGPRSRFDTEKPGRNDDLQNPAQFMIAAGIGLKPDLHRLEIGRASWR